METIKKFAFCSTTSSLAERESLFQDLFSVLKTQQGNHINLIFIFFFLIQNLIQDLPEAVFKALGKLNYYLYPKYLDKKSRSNLITLNDLLLKLNYDQSYKSILQSYESHSNSSVLTQPK